jgi:hypothetical protein
MSTHQVDRKFDELDNAMKKMRLAMRAPIVRTAGFKKNHDRTARAIAATTTTTFDAARPLFNTDRDKPRARRR